MKKECKLIQTAVTYSLIVMMMICCPLEALAQASVNRANLLEGGTQLVLRVVEDFKAESKSDNGTIQSIVEADVYSADGSKLLIKSGTPAYIEYSAERNGAWGKAGKVCMSHATTKTVNNKKVTMRMSNCKTGGSRIGGVIVLSVLFFPIGLISGCMKGSMPTIPSGSTFSASVIQDVIVECE